MLDEKQSAVVADLDRGGFEARDDNGIVTVDAGLVALSTGICARMNSYRTSGDAECSHAVDVRALLGQREGTFEG